MPAPSSMNAVLDAFFSDDTPNKIVILGDMFELGEFSRDAHINILQKVRPSTKRMPFSLALVLWESQRPLSCQVLPFCRWC